MEVSAHILVSCAGSDLSGECPVPFKLTDSENVCFSHFAISGEAEQPIVFFRRSNSGTLEVFSTIGHGTSKSKQLKYVVLG